MADPVAILFADSHLQYPGAWSSRPAIREDSFRSFEQLVDKAIELDVHLIGAGDLIDKQRNTSAPIVFLMAQMERLAEHGSNLYFIQGQHEMQAQPWLDAGGAGIHIHGRHVKLLGGMSIYGIDFHPHGQLAAEIEKIPQGVDLLVTHQVWGEFMGTNVVSPQGMLCDLPEHVGHVLTGDFHETHVKEVRNSGGNMMTVLSPGSTCLQSIAEPPEKHYFIAMSDGTFERHTLFTRPVIDWPVMTMAEDLDLFAEQIDDVLAEKSGGPFPPLLRVKYAAHLADTVHRVTRLVGDAEFIFFKEIPPEKKDAAARRARREESGERHASTLESELSDYLADREEGHLEDVIRRLLEAPDPAAEMTLIRNEMLGD
jgi:hypothetical protein